MEYQTQYIVLHLIFISPESPSDISLYKILFHKRLTVILVPLGGEHNAVFPTNRRHSSWTFPLFWQMAFSCLCIFPSFPHTAVVHNFIFALLLVLVCAPKLSQWIYQEMPWKQRLSWQDAESSTLSPRLQ